VKAQSSKQDKSLGYRVIGLLGHSLVIELLGY
jgi:hypothetical protein